MKIEITDAGVIFCDGVICDPVKMYDSCSECGGCPLVRLFDAFREIWLDGGC